ncbi:MAG: UDP-N-acetylglucosamine--N-acetylmuramyl-(pentapeptide) pyrophosphoryl-undecaprenol N-acetylglucosamine transferase [Verrucomicrobiae bacterium]|nr:UDP-N-acetylglucosamine--N-acetylmuramyl-(pentapeptide) pyrophosphoryl-undecaprenol N-acetylglucosamine transferase [Verrucomicrobiae bacterium]
MTPDSTVRRVLIACGGTGGHLFPGLAVGRELRARGVEVGLIVSPKEVDQRALRGCDAGFEALVLPAVGYSLRRLPVYLAMTFRGYRQALRAFRARRPDALLAMGGFTAVAPVLAARRLGIRSYLHESNVIPGRANRWLARLVDHGFTGFEAEAKAISRLPARAVTVTGTPVRPEFRQTGLADSAAARAALGFDANRPLLLVMGGSQGAQGVNQWVTVSAPALVARHPDLQICHLTGTADQDSVHAAYAAASIPARVLAFSDRMHILMAAATVAVSRSGASSLAEIAAVRLPAVLVPYPLAADDHQRANARVFVAAGAARMLDPVADGPGNLADAVSGLLSDAALRERFRNALAGLDFPDAAARLADGVAGLVSDGLQCRTPGQGASWKHPHAEAA